MKKSLLLVALTSFVMPFFMQAKFYAPDFESQFDKYLGRHNMAVVHFNPYPVDYTLSKLDRMKDAFYALNQSQAYNDADIAFIGVNVKKLPQLAEQYGIAVPDWDALAKQNGAVDEAVIAPEEEGTAADEEREVKAAVHEEEVMLPEDLDEQIPSEQKSTVMLFKDGRPLKADGKIVKRTGFLTENEMRNFIDKYFGGYIQRIQEEQEWREKQRVKQRRKIVYERQPQRVQRVYRRAYDYDYPYYRSYGYGGYPWGYYGRRYWGPGVGFGFGGRHGGFSIGFGW